MRLDTFQQARKIDMTHIIWATSATALELSCQKIFRRKREVKPSLLEPQNCSIEQRKSSLPIVKGKLNNSVVFQFFKDFVILACGIFPRFWPLHNSSSWLITSGCIPEFMSMIGRRLVYNREAKIQIKSDSTHS